MDKLEGQTENRFKVCANNDLARLLMNNFGKLIVIVFYADWYEHSKSVKILFNYLLNKIKVYGDFFKSYHYFKTKC